MTRRTPRRKVVWEFGNGKFPPLRSDGWEPTWRLQERDPYLQERYDLVKDRFTDDQLNWWMLTLSRLDQWYVWEHWEWPRRKKAEFQRMRDAADLISEGLKEVGRSAKAAAEVWANAVIAFGNTIGTQIQGVVDALGDNSLREKADLQAGSAPLEAEHDDRL